MSTPSWKNQGGFSKHRNVASVTIQNQKDISTLNLSLYPYANLPPAGTTGLNPGTLVYSQNSIYYKDEAGHWEALSASGSTGALWSKEEATNNIYYSHGNVGIGLNSPNVALDISGNVDVSGNVDISGNINVDTVNYRNQIGYFSTLGHGATVNKSTAIGYDCTASGNSSTAMGYITTASGSEAMATGLRTTASGVSSTAMGSETKALGDYSTAMGYGCTASGNYSMALGRSTTASGNNSMALGDSTTASGLSSTAMGSGTKALTDYSMALGDSTTASGLSSTAMGYGCTASGNYSTAMGYITTASGSEAMATGLRTTASGQYSTAMGQFSGATGLWCTAIGNRAYAGGDIQFAIGASEGVPSGIATAASNNNAFVIDISGNVGIGTTGTSHTSKLTILSPSLSSNTLELQRTGKTGKVIFQTPYQSGSEHVGLAILTGSATGASERMRITPSGDVGIHTDTPSQALDVSGNVNIETTDFLDYALKVTGGSWTGRFENNAPSGKISQISVSGGNEGLIIDATTNAPDDALLRVRGGTGTTGTAGAMPAFYVGGDGKVGIGLDNYIGLPTRELDVSGNVRIRGSLYDSINLKGTAGQILTSTGSGIEWDTGGSSSLWTLIGSDIYYDTGNVGIGLNNPSVALDISGNINVNTVNYRNQIGYFSTLGHGATVNKSTAIGYDCTASGNSSTAMGYITTASGSEAMATGLRTTASGVSSTAMGSETKALGDYSTAMGYGCTASGNYSMALGRSTTASGNNSMALGDSTTASGLSSTAMGSGTKALTDYSMALGDSTTASGLSSTAMGYGCTASGNYSTAMGYITTASGSEAMATGLRTTASGDYSTAMGQFSGATGLWCTAIGNRAYAGGDIQFAIGANSVGPIAIADVSNNNNVFEIDISGNVSIKSHIDISYNDIPQLTIMADPKGPTGYNQWATLELKGAYIGHPTTYGCGIRSTYGYEEGPPPSSLPPSTRHYGDVHIYTTDPSGNVRTDNMVIRSNGNVAIGNPIPAHGSDGIYYRLRVEGTAGGYTGTAWTGLFGNINDDGKKSNIYLSGGKEGLRINATTNTPGDALLRVRGGTGATGVDAEPGTMPAFYVGGDGKVGIGLEMPTQELDVSGNARISGGIFFNSTATQIKRDPSSGLAFLTDTKTQMTLDISGNVGIGATGGATGTNTLFVDGEIRATGDIIAFYTSDNRLKTNLQKIENPLEKLKQINGYTYDWIEKPHIHSHSGRDIGVIAQELDAIGLTGIIAQRDNGYMAVKYEKIIPLLIECIKAQQEQIDLLLEK